jgi:hypothetical protein
VLDLVIRTATARNPSSAAAQALSTLPRA